MLIPLQETVLKAGGHAIIKYLPDGTAKNFYEHAQDHQLEYIPHAHKLGEIEDKTHHIAIIADHDKHELKGINPKKITKRIQANKPYRELIDAKELRGEFTWTLGLYGTPAMAQEVNLSEEEYRQEIIKACFLDYDDPIAERKQQFSMLKKNKR